MREMHKWKDKVELSLDNRQIFFLFFGLSVVGCFVFALGVMTGRRLNWEPEGEVAALGEDSLQLLDENGELMGFSFTQGLKETNADALPETRDPEEPPRDEKEVKAEKKEAKAKAAEDAKSKVAAEKAKKAAEPKLPAKQDTALASAGKETGDEPGVRLFTLQMKAFSMSEEAEKFADKLRRNGHDIRVEEAVVRGRTWYRVRMGSFKDWDAALAAKAEFEKAEHVIAYVVSQ